MHGPGPTMPRSRPSPGVLVALRVLFVALTLCSCGLLSWAAMLRIAVVRRRRSDWALFTLVLLLAITTFVVIGVYGNEGEDTPLKAVDWICLLLLLAMAVGVTTHYLIADIQYHQRPQAPLLPPHGWLPAGQGHPATPSYDHAGRPAATPGYGYPPQQPTPPPGYQQPPRQYPQSQPQQPQQPQPHPQQPQAQPQQQPPPRPPRINQVRAELDELSELLRKEGPQDGDGGHRR
ncbi:hypothetical protein [Streptomyces sp. NPDC058657]|uniref:hypothetical protein n=1 Tax=unclassified Streptomyces TaxID=2593676 RepID=UPI003662E397